MTNEEFINMINKVLTELRLEVSQACQRYRLYKKIQPALAEEEDYKIGILNEKIEKLSKFISFPIYERINAASYVEIEEYKKNKIKNIEEKIKEFEEKIIKNEELAAEELRTIEIEIKGLENKLNELAKKYDDFNLSEDEKKEIEREAKKIVSNIKLQKYNQEKIPQEIEKMKAQIEDLKKAKKGIEKKTNLDIRDELIAQIKGKDELEKALEEVTKNSANASNNLLLSVAGDKEKVKKLAELLNEYKEISNKQKEYKSIITTEGILPSELSERILESKSCKCKVEYDKGWLLNFYSIKEVEYSDELMDIIEKFKTEFEQLKTELSEEYTEKRLQKLVGPKDNLDIDFLNLHEKKVDKEKLSQLNYILVEIQKKKSELQKSFFKRKSKKIEVENLEKMAQNIYSELINEIIKWYKSKN